jgi:hypothetical protein
MIDNSQCGSIIDRADSYIRVRLGDRDDLLMINGAIWRVIGSDPERAFQLSNISDAFAFEDVVSVLALLSSSAAGFLRMELRSKAQPNNPVSSQEFYSKLRAWWKEKTITDSEWQTWASDIRVWWTPVNRVSEYLGNP